MKRHPRAAFTLIELAVVIGILLMITLLVVSVYNQSAGGNKMREAARSAQAAFMGAKDRALRRPGQQISAQDRKGLRLLRDPNDSSLVIGFVYIQPLEPAVYVGSATNVVRLERVDNNVDSSADAPEVIRVRFPAQTITTLQDFFTFPPRIQIPNDATGRYYTFTNVRTATDIPNTELIDLQQDCGIFINPHPIVVAIPETDSRANVAVQLGNEMLPFHAPINLPSGVVIDMDRCGTNVQTAFPAGQQNDILYNPRGQIDGPLAALGPLHFMLRDVRDATEGTNPGWLDNDVAGDPDRTKGKYESMILTLFPQTGNVQTYPLDLTDLDGDFRADDVFRFAKQGNRAGQ